jgi:hypothetical protein
MSASRLRFVRPQLTKSGSRSGPLAAEPAAVALPGEPRAAEDGHHPARGTDHAHAQADGLCHRQPCWSQVASQTHAKVSRHLRDSLDRAQHRQDLARDRSEIVNGTDRLPPWPPIAPGAVLGLVAEDTLVQSCLRRIFDPEIRFSALSAGVGRKFPVRERSSEALKVLTLFVLWCHELERKSTSRQKLHQCEVR